MCIVIRCWPVEVDVPRFGTARGEAFSLSPPETYPCADTHTHTSVVVMASVRVELATLVRFEGVIAEAHHRSG